MRWADVSPASAPRAELQGLSLSPVGDDEQRVGLALDAMGRTIAGGPSGVTMVDAGPDALLLKPDDGPTCDEDDHLQGRHGRGGRRRAGLPDRDCPRGARRRW